MKKLKFFLARNKQILENFSFLSLFQILTMLIPLITYPYLIKVLGSELYGRVIYAQVLTSYFSIIVNLGFKDSAVKNISIHRNNNDKLSEILSSIFIIRLIVWLFSFFILLILTNIFQGIKEYQLLYLFSFGCTLNELLFPQYYFLGIEKMKIVSLINIFVKLLVLMLIFVLIKTSKDYLFVPLLNSVSFFIAGIISLYIIYRKSVIKFKVVSVSVMIRLIKESFPLLASNIIISIKDKFTILLLGTLTGMQDVAVYDLGMKLVALFNKFTEVINTVIFPKIAKERNMHLLKKSTKLSFVFIFFGVLLFQVFLKSIVCFLAGDSMINNIFEIRLLLFVPLIMSLSFPISHNFFIAFGHYKLLFKSMLITTIFYLSLTAFSYVFNLLTGIRFFVIISLTVYLFEFLYRIYLMKKRVRGGNQFII